MINNVKNTTAVSDFFAYKNICATAAKDESIFSSFKRNPIYTQILEHKSYHWGCEYLKLIIEKYGKEKTISLLDKAIKNDYFGGSVQNIFHIEDVVYSISPSTINYLKNWLEMTSFLKNDVQLNHVVEIGGGYGGQSLVANQLSKFESWCIFDLPEANELQRKYFEVNNMQNITYCLSTPTFSAPLINTPKQFVKNKDGFIWDLAISNYAFSEIQRDLQEIYLEEVLKKSKHGFMIMNFGWTNFENMMTVDDIAKRMPNIIVREEIPKTGPANCLIIW